MVNSFGASARKKQLKINKIKERGKIKTFNWSMKLMDSAAHYPHVQAQAPVAGSNFIRSTLLQFGMHGDHVSKEQTSRAHNNIKFEPKLLPSAH